MHWVYFLFFHFANLRLIGQLKIRSCPGITEAHGKVLTSSTLSHLGRMSVLLIWFRLNWSLRMFEDQISFSKGWWMNEIFGALVSLKCIMVTRIKNQRFFYYFFLSTFNSIFQFKHTKGLYLCYNFLKLSLPIFKKLTVETWFLWSFKKDFTVFTKGILDYSVIEYSGVSLYA